MSTLFNHKKGAAEGGIGQTPLLSLITHVKAQARKNGGNGLVEAGIGKSMVSLESADAAQLKALDSAANTLTVSLESAVAEVAAHLSTSASTLFSRVQKDAGVGMALLGGALKDYIHKPITIDGYVPPEGTQYILPSGGDISMTRFKPALEAFDEKENQNAVVYSVAYNMSAARQDEFGETFFPTVIVTPDQVGFSVSIRIHNVMSEVRRSVDGDLNAFNKRNIIQAVIDPTIFNSDNTAVVPVYSTESAKYFVPTNLIATSLASVGEEEVTTAALAVGKQFSLIGISQTEATLATGLMDNTDALDSAITLKSIYLKVGTADVFKFNTSRLPFAVWNRAPQGNYRQLSLNFTSKTLRITAATTTVAGAAGATVTPAILGEYQVSFGVSLFGNINQELGDTEVNAGVVSVQAIIDADGVAIDLTGTVALAIIAALGNMQVIGYDLEAQRVNTNRRQRGQLLDTTFYNQIYAVPLRSPLTILRPTNITDETDAADLGALITATHIRTSNEAVKTLLEAAQMLSEQTDPRNDFQQAPAILGVARDLVTPVYKFKSLDLRSVIQSLESTDRFENIQQALVNVIRDYVYNAYRDSGYQAAANALAGGVAVPPTVIIGTDPVIARYLLVTGDTRLLGDTFNVKVVSTLNNTMIGKLFVTFGDFSSGKEGVPNPMHFGNMAWKPEMTLVLPILRNGAYTKELTVQPSFLHIVNLPILLEFEILGISEVATGLVSLPVNALVTDATPPSNP